MRRLARMGAKVVGIDAAKENIDAAINHVNKDPVVNYIWVIVFFYRSLFDTAIIREN